MNDFEFLQSFLQDEPEAATQTKGAAEDFLKKPVETSGGVTVHPGKALPDHEEAPHIENKSVGKHAKESLLPKVRKVADTRERAQTILGAAVPDVSEVPVPSGGIGLLLFISLIMVFAITPINGVKGVTRLQLLWGTMLGNYSINSGQSTKGSSNQGKGSSSDSSGLTPDEHNAWLQGHFS